MTTTAGDDWAAQIIEQEKKLSDQVAELALVKDKPVPPAEGGDAAAVVTAAADAAPTDAATVTNGEQKDDEEKEATAADASLINKLLRNKLVASKADLEVLQADPTSPLYSVKTFDALKLKPNLLRGVYGMGFNAPSKIQETALPALINDPPANMIAQSQSGTGKTAAFVLTMLSRVDASLQHPQCICLAPTYELALQIGDVAKEMAKYMEGLSICFAVRGNRVTRGQMLKDQILIGTPGTMLDWCVKMKVVDLKKVKVFVLDEADVMIDTQGHQDQSIRIQRNLSKDCQMLLFSATYDNSVMKFAEAIVPNPVTIRLRREEESLDNISQYYISARDKEGKFEALSNIYGTLSIGQSMIFCHTRKTASWLNEKMTQEGHAVALLSGELAIEDRASVIRRFRDGQEKVLITTNVSARGIDVEQVTVVVNFDLPVTNSNQADCETYLHRIGRTGRFGKTGIALNMVEGQRSHAVLKTIEAHFGRKIEQLDASDIEAIEKIAGQ